MKKTTKSLVALLAVLLLGTMLTVGYSCFAEGDNDVSATETVGVTEEAETQESDNVTSKAVAAAACVTIASAVGAVSMGVSIKKAVDGISRQPEADGKIRTTLMLGLVFIETAIIYALFLAILIIFVL